MMPFLLPILLRIITIFSRDASLMPRGVNLRQEIRLVRALGSPSSLRLLTQSPEPKTIALTFDDGPHKAWTPKLLATLQALDVKATFFVVGKMVEKAPWLVREEAALGHDIGNHTYHHYNLDLLSEIQIEREYKACSDAVQRATGVRPIFCRPPGGRFDCDVVKAAENQKLWTVLWTDDPGDFARPSAATLVDRIDHQMKQGGILLLHDGIPQTIEILPELVARLRAKGYRFVTCSQLLAEQSRTYAKASRHRRTSA